MDPITATIVWGVVWFFAGSVGTVVIYFILFGIGFLLSEATESDWPAAISVGLGWLFAIAWQIFVLIQVIIHTVTLIQLITAGV